MSENIKAVVKDGQIAAPAYCVHIGIGRKAGLDSLYIVNNFTVRRKDGDGICVPVGGPYLVVAVTCSSVDNIEAVGA